MAKMNSMNLYVTTTQIIVKSNANNPNSWQDLYRLIPYLRNSLCCVVCGYLLVDPMSPATAKCQHHMCKQCQGGRKKIKPMCLQCKDGITYSENKQLRTLLQCYKRMCTMLINSCIYKELEEQASKSGAGSLISLIKEGEAFEDDYKSTVGLPKSTYSILPCVYTNSSTQTLQAQQQQQQKEDEAIAAAPVTAASAPNLRTPLYSVMCAGGGNKITIKRKPKLLSGAAVEQDDKAAVFKRPRDTSGAGGVGGGGGVGGMKQRRGCRCGNATATPGKLTCCGQRCPCYVDGKACIECKCRGCRNPHTPDGNKVIPHYLQEFQQVAGGGGGGGGTAAAAAPAPAPAPSPHLAAKCGAQMQLQLAADLVGDDFKIELGPGNQSLACATITMDQFRENLQLDVSDDYAGMSLAMASLPPITSIAPMSHMFVRRKSDGTDEEVSVDIC